MYIIIECNLKVVNYLEKRLSHYHLQKIYFTKRHHAMSNALRAVGKAKN